MKRQTLVPRLNSSGKKPKSSRAAERSNSARPLPKIQGESPRIFLTGGMESDDIKGLTDQEIIEMMETQGAKTRSCEEMLAELDALETIIKSQVSAMSSIQHQVATFKTDLEASAGKTQEIEDKVVSMLSEVNEESTEAEGEGEEPPRTLTLPDIRRPRDDGSMDTASSSS